VPTPEAKKKATTKRIISVVLWVLAIAAEVVGIFQLRQWDEPLISKIPALYFLIGIIVVDLILVIIAGFSWKGADKLDPPSKKNKFAFILQTQFAVLMAAICFVPLIVLIFTNKNMKGKDKGILGAVACVALVIAVLCSINYNPPSKEEYAAQKYLVYAMTGKDEVFWLNTAGSSYKYHIYETCSAIGDKEHSHGTVAEAGAQNQLKEDSLCLICLNKYAKDEQYAALRESAVALGVLYYDSTGKLTIATADEINTIMDENPLVVDDSPSDGDADVDAEG